MNQKQTLLASYKELSREFQELGNSLQEAGARLAGEGFMPQGELLEKILLMRKNFFHFQKEVLGLENCFLPKDKIYSLGDLGTVVEWLFNGQLHQKIK